jgi:hypothetical protein
MKKTENKHVNERKKRKSTERRVSTGIGGGWSCAAAAPERAMSQPSPSPRTCQRSVCCEAQTLTRELNDDLCYVPGLCHKNSREVYHVYFTCNTWVIFGL